MLGNETMIYRAWIHPTFLILILRDAVEPLFEHLTWDEVRITLTIECRQETTNFSVIQIWRRINLFTKNSILIWKTTFVTADHEQICQRCCSSGKQRATWVFSMLLDTGLKSAKFKGDDSRGPATTPGWPQVSISSPEEMIWISKIKNSSRVHIAL